MKKKAAPKAKAKPKAAAPRTAAPSAGAPDLAWLVGPASTKLRALLRKPDQSKIHQLLDEANLFGSRSAPFVHPDTTRAIAGPLIAALDDSAEIVRKNAAWLLGVFGPPEACEPLARVVAADPSVPVRARAAEALGWLVAPGAAGIAPLVAALAHPGNHTDDSGLRDAAASALAHQATLDVALAPAILAALEREEATYVRRGGYSVPGNEPDWNLAQLLAPALARMGTAALPALRDALASPRAGVRSLAVMALCRVIWRGEPVAADEVTPALQALSKDAGETETTRAHAAIALAALHPKRATEWLEPLGEALTTETMSWTVRLQALAIVRALGAAARPLFPRMHAPRMHAGGLYLQRALLAALGLSARDLMTAAVASGDIAPSEMAVWLALVGAPDAFDRLSDLAPADSGEASDANELRHRLLARTGPRGVAAVRALLASPNADDTLAVAAICGLRAASAPDRAALLALGLAAPNSKIRATAAGLAAAAGDAGAAAELERLWAEDDETVLEAIAVTKAPATALLDRVCTLVEGRAYRYYGLRALAILAAASPVGPRRSRALAALAGTYHAGRWRWDAEYALAQAGITRGLEEPNGQPWDDDL